MLYLQIKIFKFVKVWKNQREPQLKRKDRQQFFRGKIFNSNRLIHIKKITLHSKP